jgi:phosphate transport system protein
MLEERIQEIKKKLVEYATLIETMIDKSINGLLKKEAEVLESIIGVDEPKSNNMEIEFEELCISTIAKYAPKAQDLRTILMALKMNNDFERMGDHAVNIAESALFLIARPPVKPLIDIPRMAEETIKMVKSSINAFINGDTVLAKEICEMDDIIDGLRNQILRELITFMSTDPGTIERSFHLIRISQNLERIADLSTNICEDVIFMVEGRVIKHHKG